VGILPHFRGGCFYQHLSRLQVGLFFSSKFFSFHIRDPFPTRICLPFFGKWSKWTGFIHITSLWWQPLYFTKYSFFLKHVYLTWSMRLISMTSLCLKASISNHTFYFWYGFYSSCKNNLNFEMWKVTCATKLTGNFRVYMLDAVYVKFHKALHTWRWNMGLVHRAFKNLKCLVTCVAQPQTQYAFMFYWHAFHTAFEPIPRASSLKHIFLHALWPSPQLPWSNLFVPWEWLS
jgi:hypothetical protein